jgi:cation transport regulator
MPYVTAEDLPPSLRRHLPPHAQEIYRAALNAAWSEYADHPEREGVAHRVAWASVKKRYVKEDDSWVPR